MTERSLEKMMFFGLLKIFAITLFVYLMIHIIKALFFVNRTIKNANKKQENIKRNKYNSSNKTIELDKDQYKVE